MRTIFILGMYLLAAAPALADADSYRKTAIADASRFVAARKATALATDSSAKQVLENLALARFYKAGDRWTIAVSRVSPGMVYAVDNPAAHQNHFLEPVFYEFHVMLVKRDEEAYVEVTERGKKAPRTLLTISRQMRLDQSTEAEVRVSFDAFPIELPDFARAKILAPGIFPKAGVPRVSLVRQQQHVVVPEQSVAFETPDLYSRPMRVLWQRGDLWPAEVETASGYSVLIRQDKI